MRRLPPLLLLLLSLGCQVAGGASPPKLSRYTYQQLHQVEGLLDQERYQEAEKRLEALRKRVETGYERALVEQTQGYVALGLNDEAAALEHFRGALAEGGLPERVAQELRYARAQLLLRQGRAKAARAQLEEWFAREAQPNPESRVLLGQIHAELGQWRAAADQLQQAIAQASRPAESWYQLLLAAYLEEQRLKPAARLLRRLVRRFPRDPTYWRQYASVLMQLKRHRQAATVLALANDQGLLRQPDLLTLARLYLQINAPLNAARLLERALAKGRIEARHQPLELLADAWILAREPAKAIRVLERLAAIDPSGRPQLRAGALLMEQEQWRAAAAKLKEGLRLQARPAAGDWLRLGSVYLRLGEEGKAGKAFRQAAKRAVSKRERELARRWLDYLAAG